MKPVRAKFLQPVATVIGQLISRQIVGLSGDDLYGRFALPQPGSPPIREDVEDGTIFAGVWEQDGAIHVNANVASWEQRFFEGTPYELSWLGSAASIVLGAPLEQNSVGITFAGEPVEVGYDAQGRYNVNVRVTRNGATLTVNEVEAGPQGAKSIGLHLLVPGVGEAKFNVVEVVYS